MSDTMSQSCAELSASAASKPKQRVIFIDVLRGYAILMMLQGHVVGVVLDESYRDESHWLYGSLYYLKGLTAPCFFVAAGMIFSYLMSKKVSDGIPFVSKGISRGLWLVFLGYVLQWKAWPLSKLGTEEWVRVFYFLGDSHVLHTMGLSLILIVLLRRISCAKIFYFLTLGLAFVAILYGAWVYEQDWGDGFPRGIGTFLGRSYAVFPLLPWCGFVLVGAALGAYGWEKAWFSSGKFLVALAAIGGGVMLFGMGLDYVDIPQLPYGEQSSVSFWRLGEVLIFVALLAWACAQLEKMGKIDHWSIQILRKAGGETLFIYFVHAVLIYGCITSVGLNTYLGGNLGPWATFLVVLLVEVFFITCAFQLPSLRKKLGWLKYLR